MIFNSSFVQSFYKCIFIVLTLLIINTSYSYALPGWAKDAIAKSDSMTVDSKASAWILVNDHEVQISSSGDTKRFVRKAIKLLKTSGKEYTNLYESISDMRKIYDVKGWHIKNNGKVETLEKENMAEVTSNTSAGYYDDAMIFLATFGDIDIGEVVVYEYLIKEKSNWDTYFQSFNIQRQEPVLSASFKVSIPDGWELFIGSHYADVCYFEKSKNEYHWTASNLDYRPEEKLMPPWYYMNRYIKISCYNPNEIKDYNFTSWYDASSWAESYLTRAVNQNQELIDFVNQNFSSLPTTEEKIEAISKFVRDEVRYVAVEIGKGKFTPRSATKTFYNRYGDCKDKVALMRAMLGIAKIPSVSVLASVGSYVDPALPTPLQFDHCILGIHVDSISDVPEKPNATIENWVLFDPTDPSQKFGELPMQLYGSKVLIADPSDTTLIRIPYISPDKNHRKYIADAELDTAGNFSSDITIIDYGSKASQSAYLLASTKLDEIENSYKRKFEDILPSVSLSDFSFVQQDDSTIIKFHLSKNDYIIKSGDLRFLPVDFIYEARLPSLKKGERIHPIWFGTFKQIDFEINWTLDSSWKIESPIDSIYTDCKEGTYTYSTFPTENGLLLKAQYISQGGLLDKNEYSMAREFRSAMMKGRNMKLKLEQSK